jgi:hypothetical protein
MKLGALLKGEVFNKGCAAKVVLQGDIFLTDFWRFWKFNEITKQETSIFGTDA